MKSIYAAYKEEASVKRIILENIAHQHRDIAKMLYFTSWVYQTQIPDSLRIKLLEPMLIETGLR